MRVGVVGVGAIGRHHARLFADLEGCRLVGVTDLDAGRRESVAETHGCSAFADLRALLERVDAVSVAVPTLQHAEVAHTCLQAERDVLIEKPIAATLEEADGLVAAARRGGRILQVGHVERYNPAVEAALPRVHRPGFVEVHRLGSFTPRSLEVDVVLDLMIHDLDVLDATLGDDELAEVRAVGVPVLSEEIDIANARLQFAGGCIANLTASRVSLERVRKVRIFQPESYLSVDYAAQEVAHYRLLRDDDGRPSIRADPVHVDRAEPLARELQDFIAAVSTRRPPRVDGTAGRRALALALQVRDAIARSPLPSV